MRGILSFLVLAAVIAGGAWYFLMRSDAPVEAPPAAGAPGAGQADAGGTAEPGAAVTDATTTAGAATAPGAAAGAPGAGQADTGGTAKPVAAVTDTATTAGAATAPGAEAGTPPAADAGETAEPGAAETGTATTAGATTAAGAEAGTPPVADTGETAGPVTAETGTATMAGATTAAGVAAEAEAKKYVETLTEPTSRPIPVEKADHFATPERVLSLVPEDAIEQTTLRELAGDASLDADTPLTVVREVEQLETLTPEQLIAESEGNFEAPVRVLEEDDVRLTTVSELLEDFSAEPDKPLSIVRVVRHFEITTLGELLESGEDPEAFLDVITQPYRVETATLAELLEQRRAMKPGSIFYLRTVRPTDEQGIWGIVHDGIIKNFARGMAIRDGEEIETYTVHIPREADEMSLDRTSSFLGKLIHRKTEESFVYNFRRNRMGHNPDRIYPGQEIVIIDFQPEELIAIYRHFKDSADGRG